MSLLRHFPLAFAAALLVGSPFFARSARAEENLLHGPHPFLKDNELSVHVLVGEGLDDAPSGAKLGIDYGYKLTGGPAPLWLDLEINIQHAGCAPMPAGAPCGEATGDAVESLVGVKWKFATPLPVVPYVKAAGGLVLAFPNAADNAAGLMIRAGAGANYFFFDWLGLGAEVGFSEGRIDYDSTFSGGHGYAVLDFGVGLEFQF